MNARHPIAMQEGVDHNRDSRVITGVTPPFGSDTKIREFGGAVLICLLMLPNSSVPAYPTAVKAAAPNVLRIKALRSSG
jgi:hypothetical protein